jgi:hypothetical protein
VERTEDKKTGGEIIRIEITGRDPEDRRFFLRTIRNQLEKIHKRSFTNLVVFEKIPCCCTICSDSNEPTFYDRADLDRRKERGQKTVECSISYEDVPVQALLDGVFSEGIELGSDPIRDMVAEGKLEEAINLGYVNYRDDDTMVLLRGSYQANETAKNRDLISPENYSRNRNRFGEALLEIARKKGGTGRKGRMHVDLKHQPGQLDELKKEISEIGDNIRLSLEKSDAIHQETLGISESLRHHNQEVLQILLQQNKELDAQRVWLEATFSGLEKGQAETIQTIYAEVGQLSAKQQMSLQRELEEKLAPYRDRLDPKQQSLLDATETSASVEGMLKLMIPIIPFVLEYEVSLGAGQKLDLAAFWGKLKDKIFGPGN